VKPEKALSWQRIFLFYYSFSLFAFMPFRVQRKRIKRKGSQSLAGFAADPQYADYLEFIPP